MIDLLKVYKSLNKFVDLVAFVVLLKLLFYGIKPTAGQLKR
jgi:hypothetical protein